MIFFLHASFMSCLSSSLSLQIAKLYGSDVFSDAVLKDSVSESAFKEYQSMKSAGAHELTRALADTIANSMLV